MEDLYGTLYVPHDGTMDPAGTCTTQSGGVPQGQGPGSPEQPPGPLGLEDGGGTVHGSPVPGRGAPRLRPGLRLVL